MSAGSRWHAAKYLHLRAFSACSIAVESAALPCAQANHCRTCKPAQSYHPPMDTRLLELLVCPVTKGPLEYDREKQELTSRSARLAYPVRDDIPILLETEARALTDEELGL